MSAEQITGWLLVAIAVLALSANAVDKWRAANRVIDTPAHDDGDELDAWLAMSPTPTHDRLCVEFFDAALGDEGRTA